MPEKDQSKIETVKQSVISTASTAAHGLQSSVSGTINAVRSAAETLKEKASGLSLEQAFDASLIPARQAAYAQVNRIKERNPNISKIELIQKLEKRYISQVTSTGVVVGGTAAAPGVGTLTAIGAALGETGVLMTSTVVHVYSMLKAVEAELADTDHERALILMILSGGPASSVVNKISDRVGTHLSKRLVKKIPASSLRKINKVLGINFFTKFGTRQGIVVLGKVMPFGIGAAVGGGMNYVFGKAMIKGTRFTFAELLEETEGGSGDIVGTEGIADLVDYLKDPNGAEGEGPRQSNRQ